MYLRDVKTQEKDLFIDTLLGDLPMHLSFNLVQSYDQGSYMFLTTNSQYIFYFSKLF